MNLRAAALQASWRLSPDAHNKPAISQHQLCLRRGHNNMAIMSGTRKARSRYDAVANRAAAWRRGASARGRQPEYERVQLLPSPQPRQRAAASGRGDSGACADPVLSCAHNGAAATAAPAAAVCPENACTCLCSLWIRNARA